MLDTLDATRRSIEVGKLHVVEQEARIARQRVLLNDVLARGHGEQAATADRLLQDMTDLLEVMKDDVAKAEERLRLQKNAVDRKRLDPETRDASL
jgi:hypothetical protein